MSINPNANLGSNANIILQTLKRRTVKHVTPLDERVTLEKAFGFTITSNSRLAQFQDGTIAYLAGCVIVLYDIKTLKQEFIISTARKTLTTLALSSDGRIIATGESGHDPKVRIWDVKEKVQLAEFGGHKFSIECVCFSPNPNTNLIVSIGSVHDMAVNVWNWRTKFKVASNKIACKVKGIAFSQDGSYFVTVGNRLVKFWYLTISTLMETVPLKGRAAILSDMKHHNFCDVVCGRGECAHLTYAITMTGTLCEFDEKRSLCKVTELRTDRAYCLYQDDENLFIGCSGGTILMFRQKNLEFLACLPRPHNLGVSISKGLDTRHLIENLNNTSLKYPDCVALCFNPSDKYLCAIYNDHSLYIWDINDVHKVKKVDSHLFHSSCCWSLDIYANQLEPNATDTSLPLDSFITCSSDNTLRIWSPMLSNLNPVSIQPNPSNTHSNIYSKELINMLYIDNDLSALCDNDFINNTGPENGDSNTTNASNQLPIGNNESTNSQLSKLGARCLKISPFGDELATGDRNGNIRIYDLSTLQLINLIEAHESEILNLQYSQPESGRLLLASSSRDRLIHIFDAKRNYVIIQTLDDHSAAITATRFCFNHIDKQFFIISCGFDKSIIIRSAVCNNEFGSNELGGGTSSSSSSAANDEKFVRSNYVVEKQTFYDFIVDPSRNYINTISQDRIVRTYSIKDGKKLRQFKGSLNEDGYLLKMDMDRTGSWLATSCSDKCVYIWDLSTCECLATLCGHSELIIDLKFTNDNKYLITVSGDSCVFVWKLAALSNFMQQPTAAAQNVPNLQNFQNLANLRRSVAQTFNCADLYSSESTSTVDNDEISERASSLWARRILTPLNAAAKSDSQMSVNLSCSFSTSESCLSKANGNGNDGNGTVRRSRPLWGPVCNTSFAIMVESEADDDRSQMEVSTCSSAEVRSYLTPTTPLAKNNPFASSTSAELSAISSAVLAHSSSCNSITSDISLPIIPFPSPSVEKGLYQAVSVDTHLHKTVTKLTAIADESREDEAQETPPTPTKDSQYFTFGSSALAASDDTLLNANNKLLTLSPDSCTFAELNNDTSKYFGTLNDTLNSTQRRQSISARYLMKSQQTSTTTTITTTSNDTTFFLNPPKNSLNTSSPPQLHTSLQSPQQPTPQLQAPQQASPTPSTSTSTSSSSLTSSLSSLMATTSSVPTTSTSPSLTNGAIKLLNINNTHQPFISPTHTSGTISTAQLTADMLKNRSKKTANLLQMSSLYSQHTESSLNKIRAKQAQQHQQNTMLQVAANNIENTTKMNKSPSMNSLPPATNDSGTDAEIIIDDKNMPFKTPRQSISAKSSPTKQQNLLTHLLPQNSNPPVNSNINSNLNLKKAASMMSLAANNNNNNPVASSTVQSSVSSTASTNRSSTQRASNSTLNNLATNTLPPKTVRQVKQKSIDSRNTTATTTTTTTTNAASRVRKLSNSTQNLHDGSNNANAANHHHHIGHSQSHNSSPTKEPIRHNSLVKTTQKYKRRSVTEECSKQQQQADAEPMPQQTATSTHIKIKDASNHHHHNHHHHADHENKSPHANKKLHTDSQSAYEKILTEFKTSIYSLELVYSQTKIEELSELEQKQKAQVIEKFNSAVNTFINQLEMIKVKQTLSII